MSALNRPEFFKVFLPHFSSKRMKIPLRFIRYMEGRTSGSVLLSGHSGNTWKVDLMKKKDSLFFDEGWPIFVRDHGINLGEFLLFRCDGNLKFTVTIYDHSACKKEAAVYAKCSQPAYNIAKGKKRARAKAATSSFKSHGDSPKRTKVKHANCSQPADNIAKGKKRARAKAATSSFKSHRDSPKRTKAYPKKISEKTSSELPRKDGSSKQERRIPVGQHN